MRAEGGRLDREARRHARRAGLGALACLFAWSLVVWAMRTGRVELLGPVGLGTLLLGAVAFALGARFLRAGAAWRCAASRFRRRRPVSRLWPHAELAIGGEPLPAEIAALGPSGNGVRSAWLFTFLAFVQGLIACSLLGPFPWTGQVAKREGTEALLVGLGAAGLVILASWVLLGTLRAAVREGRRSAVPAVRVGAASLLILRQGLWRDRPERWALSALAGLRAKWRQGRPEAVLSDGRRLRIPTHPDGELPAATRLAPWDELGRALEERFGPVAPPRSEAEQRELDAARRWKERIASTERWTRACLVGLVALAAWAVVTCFAAWRWPEPVPWWLVGALAACAGWCAFVLELGDAAVRAARRPGARPRLGEAAAGSWGDGRRQVETGLDRLTVLPVLLFLVLAIGAAAAASLPALGAALVGVSALLIAGATLERLRRLLSLHSPWSTDRWEWCPWPVEPGRRLPTCAVWYVALPGLALGILAALAQRSAVPVEAFWLAVLVQLAWLFRFVFPSGFAHLGMALAPPEVGPRGRDLVLAQPGPLTEPWTWELREWPLEELAGARLFRESHGWEAHLGERGAVRLPPHFTAFETAGEVREELRRLQPAEGGSPEGDGPVGAPDVSRSPG